MHTFLLLHGPNLNLLGEREPDIYGRETLAGLEEGLTAYAREHGASLLCMQSNHEGELIDFIQKNAGRARAALINAGALSHTSIALRDALLATRLRFVEIHISNIFAREEYRRKSYLADIALGAIAGLGTSGYRYALDYLLARADEL
jgi:3-dehydroquinate dehydratase-2